MYYIDQISSMFKEQLYTSVLSFGSAALNMGEKFGDIVTETQQISILIMCGDSAYFIQDYVRAESFYRRALQLYKSLAKGLTNLKEFLPEDSNDVKYKLYLCLMQCKKPKEALNMLQSIPAKSRAVRTNMALGKLYMQTGMERAAITSFKEVLRECPNSMEAIESLISLGLKEADLQSFFQQTLNKMPCAEWFFSWIKAQHHLYQRDYPGALTILNNLTDHLPLQNNHYLLYTLATTYTYNGDYEEAIGPLLMCHRQEPSNLRGMDLLAFLLWFQRRTADLEKLTQRVTELNHNENRPEAWIALAYYAQLTGRGQKGASFAQRALTCTSTKSIEGLICKGQLLLENKKVQDAAECFREAIQLCSNRFEPHDGLVNCYLDLQRYRDASTIANFAMKKLGQTPRVLTLCAQPLSKDPLNFAKAKTYLEKALHLDKRYLPAVLTLTEILEEECQYDIAIQKLQELADSGIGGTQVHLRMAQLLSKMNSEDRAADHFAIALRLDPSSRDAREGLHRLDPTSNRSGVHEPSQVTSYDLDVDHLEVDEDEDEHDLEAVDSELDPSIWGRQGDF